MSHLQSIIEMCSSLCVMFGDSIWKQRHVPPYLIGLTAQSPKARTQGMLEMTWAVSFSI